MKHYLLLAGCIAALFFYGCKSNSTSTPPGPTVVIPNIGTSWLLLNHHVDSTGKVTKIDTSKRIVVATNMTYAAYSDVVMTIETNLSTQVADTIYLRYLSNGDISRSSSPAIDPELQHWFTVPYASQGAQSLAFGGATTNLGYTHDSVSFTATYTGTENDTVSGVIYPAIVVTSTTWQHATSATKDSLTTITQTNSFIPTKGIFGNHIVSSNVIRGKQVNHNQQTLISVDLK
jgi:hypothetical protein